MLHVFGVQIARVYCEQSRRRFRARGLYILYASIVRRQRLCSARRSCHVYISSRLTTHLEQRSSVYRKKDGSWTNLPTSDLVAPVYC